MELDKRIKEGKRPLTCFDVEEAKKYIGKDCYFASKFERFENLSIVSHATLHNVDDGPVPFQCYDDDGVFCYDCFILPCEWVKPEEPEKKYREYKDLDEFFDVTGLEIGDLIKLKFPGNNVAELLIVGGCDDCLFIGIHKYTFKQLFDMVEISISGEWQPFGIKE